MCHIWKRTKHCWLNSPPLAQRCSAFQQNGNFLAEASFKCDYNGIFSWFDVAQSDWNLPLFFPLNRWAPIIELGQSADPDWTLFLSKQVAACSRRGSRSHHGDGGDRGDRGVGHHFPGLLRCPGGGVQTPLLPPSRPAAPLWLQVSEVTLKYIGLFGFGSPVTWYCIMIFHLFIHFCTVKSYCWAIFFCTD